MPPIPAKIADGLPARLGAPEPTLQDLVYGERKREKKGIATIQEWVGCFNTYIAVVLIKEPTRAKDLLAYSSMIAKASSEYEKEAWLGYDRLFRQQAAAEPAMFPNWGEINPSIWTQHFSMVTARIGCGDCGSKEHRKCQASTSAYQSKRSESRPHPYSAPACKRWNYGAAGCNIDRCNFRHVCEKCLGGHQAKQCTKEATERKEGKEKQGHANFSSQT